MIELILVVAVVFLIVSVSRQGSRLAAIERALNIAPNKAAVSETAPTSKLVMPVVSHESKLAPTPTEKAIPVAQQKSRISEAQIGKEWFNKIGAISIVIGVVLFISYTFQYLGPLGKIMIGYAGSGLLIGLGLFFSKKYKNYANGLLAVGWAILYFTTYATHYIIASQIIVDPNITVFLLFLVSAALTIFSYFYRAEEFSILAVLLGALSAIISPVTLISLIAIVILMLSAAFISISRNWGTLGFFSVIVSYLTYWLATIQHGALTTYDQFRLGSLFLIIYFILFVMVSFFIKSGKYKEAQYVGAMITANAFGFFSLFLSQLYKFRPDADGYFTALLALTLFIISAITYVTDKEKKYFYTTYAWLGWGFATLAIPLQLTGTWIAGVWLVEGAVLLITGLVRNKVRFQFTGGVTLALFGIHFIGFDLLKTQAITLLQFEIKERVIFSLCSAVVFLVIAVVWDKVRTKLTDGLNQGMFVPSLVAVCFVMLPVYSDGDRDIASLILLLIAVTTYGVGLLANRDYLRTISLLPFAATLLQWGSTDLFSRETLSRNTVGSLNYRTLNSLIIVATLYVLHVVATAYEKYLSEFEKNIRDAFAIVASAVLVIFTWFEVSRRLTTMFWSIEGVLILITGLLTGKRVLRLTGIVIMLLAILRIFLIDLSFLETIYRIASFIVLGAILMGISFLYTKYKDNIL